jgi:hypothetical protein
VERQQAVEEAVEEVALVVPSLDGEYELDIVIGDWRSWLMQRNEVIDLMCAIARLFIFVAQRKLPPIFSVQLHVLIFIPLIFLVWLPLQ